MDDNLKTISKKIRLVREIKGISQDYIATELGISQNAYSLIENGKSKLTVDRLIRIIELLNVSLDELLALNEQVIFNKKKTRLFT